MKKYFYTDGSNIFGPFTLEELKGKEITKDTKIWFQELEDWRSANQIPLLTDMFIYDPPPIIGIEENSVDSEIFLKPQEAVLPQPKKRHWFASLLKDFIASLIIIVGVFSGVSFIKAGNKLNEAGEYLLKLKSQSGYSVAEFYYNGIGHYGIAYSDFAFGMGMLTIIISLGIGTFLFLMD
jgi:hypothetical protein